MNHRWVIALMFTACAYPLLLAAVIQTSAARASAPAVSVWEQLTPAERAILKTLDLCGPYTKAMIAGHNFHNDPTAQADASAAISRLVSKRLVVAVIQGVNQTTETSDPAWSGNDGVRTFGIATTCPKGVRDKLKSLRTSDQPPLFWPFTDAVSTAPTQPGPSP